MNELIEKAIGNLPSEEFARERIKGSPLKPPPSQWETPLFPGKSNETSSQCSVPNISLHMSDSTPLEH